jgi:hypothetical protein
MRIAWDDDEAALGKFLRSQDSRIPEPEMPVP